VKGRPQSTVFVRRRGVGVRPREERPLPTHSLYRPSEPLPFMQSVRATICSTPPRRNEEPTPGCEPRQAGVVRRSSGAASARAGRRYSAHPPSSPVYHCRVFSGTRLVPNFPLVSAAKRGALRPPSEQTNHRERPRTREPAQKPCASREEGQVSPSRRSPPAHRRYTQAARINQSRGTCPELFEGSYARGGAGAGKVTEQGVCSQTPVPIGGDTISHPGRR
jgi:hypothetical protein